MTMLNWPEADYPIPDHDHQWGPVEHAFFTGNPHRKCKVDGCRFVSLDLHDDELTNWTVEYEVRSGDVVEHRGEVTVRACEDTVEACAREDIFGEVLGIERADIDAKVVPWGDAWPKPSYLSAWRMEATTSIVVLIDCVRHLPEEES